MINQFKTNTPKLNALIPPGTLKRKWPDYVSGLPQVPVPQRSNYSVIVIGSGLSACAAAASLGELGYNVKVIFSHESPRHECASYLRGGLNASKNYANDGDSDERFFKDTIEFGSWRSREADVCRMAQLSCRVLDVCTALGVPFLRDEGGLLLPRPYPGAASTRSFQARGQTGRQLLLTMYSAMLRQVSLGRVALYERREVSDIVIQNDMARGVTARNIVTGETESYCANAVLICCGGYSDIYSSFPDSMSGGIGGLWAAYKHGAGLANPCFSLSVYEDTNRFNPIPEDYISSNRCPGGLWVNYNLQTSIKGLFALGEANFSAHGANCMQGNAPLQELADGLFIIPPVLSAYLATTQFRSSSETDSEFIISVKRTEKEKEKIFAVKGRTPPAEFHRRLAKIMRDNAGFIRHESGLQRALKQIQILLDEFHKTVAVPDTKFFNQTLEKAIRTKNYMEFSALLIKDALARQECCGGHYREDFPTPYHPEDRDFEKFKHISVWFKQDYNKDDICIKEPLSFLKYKPSYHK